MTIAICLVVVATSAYLGVQLIKLGFNDKTDPVDVHVDDSITLDSDTRGLL